MSQSVRGSALEAVANVLAGVVLGLALQAGLQALYGLRWSGPQQLSIVVAFTLSSLLRSFALRRLFVAGGDEAGPPPKAHRDPAHRGQRQTSGR